MVLKTGPHLWITYFTIQTLIIFDLSSLFVKFLFLMYAASIWRSVKVVELSAQKIELGLELVRIVKNHLT